MGDLSPLDSPTGRRSVRNSLSGGSSSIVPGGVGIGLGGGATGANSMSGMGIGNGLSLAGMAAGGGMAAAANAAASSLSTLAASANIVDRCGSAGANIISGSAAGIGGSHSGGAGNGSGTVGIGGNGVGSGGGNNGPISLGSGAGAAHHLGGSTGILKQECDSLMHPGGSSSSSGMGYTHVPPIYRPINYEPPRKRAIVRSPYSEQEQRGSVLRDGSKSSECPSPINKPPYHRPSSSASSTAPTEADTMHSERASPQSRWVHQILFPEVFKLIRVFFFPVATRTIVPAPQREMEMPPVAWSVL